MPQKIEVPNIMVFEGLFAIWKERNYDLYFYFSEIFDKALAALSSAVTTLAGVERRVTALEHRPQAAEDEDG